MKKAQYKQQEELRGIYRAIALALARSKQNIALDMRTWPTANETKEHAVLWVAEELGRTMRDYIEETIDFPLDTLVRESFDRVLAQVGEGKVSLDSVREPDFPVPGKVYAAEDF